MTVRLIAITKPVAEEFGDNGSPEELISYCARVSNPGNQLNFETSEKLLRYCMKKKHWSIFEQANMTLEITTTRDIGRQILRHGMRPQEFSGRYAEYNLENFVFRECRMQDTKNRQNSLECVDPDLIEGWRIWQEKVATVSGNAYKWAIENGLAKEQARVVLPEGMTPTVMYFNGFLRNWIHYIDARVSPETQKEHRLIGNECRDIIVEQFPFLKDYWSSDNE